MSRALLLLSLLGVAFTAHAIQASRVSDLNAYGAAVLQGAPTVFILGQPAARLGDPVAGGSFVGQVTTGSGTVLIGGLPAARVGSTTVGVNPVDGMPAAAPLITGAPNVLIGN